MATFNKSCPSSFTSKSSTISGLLFFAVGLSFGFAIGFYDLHTLPLKALSYSTTPIPLSDPPSPPFYSEEQTLSYKTTKNNTITSFPPQEEDESSLRNQSDEELLRKASIVDQLEEMPKNLAPKVAFMFLTRGPMPLSPLWELFFKRHTGYYSIYVHAHPSYKDTFPRGSVFHGRFIPSQEVEWGSITMVSAERRLLANALLDLSNQRFILLSESCIPIFNFTTIYDYLINSTLSFVNSFYTPEPVVGGRYKPTMSPLINITNWRKGSQWFEVHRELAIPIVSDSVYFNAFEEHFSDRYSDEHYLPTLFNIKYPSLISNRTITYVDWSKRRQHPASFEGEQVSEKLLDWIKFGSNCTYNGVETHTCFLFARKFMPSSLEPLLRFLIFDP